MVGRSSKRVEVDLESMRHDLHYMWAVTPQQPNISAEGGSCKVG